MAYRENKETSNPFIPKVIDKWADLTSFDGNSTIEIIVKSISEIIVLIILVVLIPIGTIISIYNSFYNLQKKSYDDLMYDNDSSSSQFASSVEFGIYFILSLPFLFILVPYWIITSLVTWFAKHKTLTIVLVVVAVICYILRDYIKQLL